MTFASLDNQMTREAIEDLASAPHLAVFVGAGVSAESGLPPWPQLVRRLLARASQKVEHFDSQDQREDWIDRTLASELPDGAAGIAQTLLGEKLPEALREELYKAAESAFSSNASRFAPGQTAHAVAALRVACDGSSAKTAKMKILTTNYDDLLERALRERKDISGSRVKSFVWPVPGPKRAVHPDDIKVHHLHGLLPQHAPAKGEVILTDRSFNRQSPAKKARDARVQEILAHSSCLFLGTSFSDPNIIRYLDQATILRQDQMEEENENEPMEHVAIFTHHSTDPEAVQRTRESIAAARLGGAMTRVVFLDHYADVAQFVHELQEKICSGANPSHTRRSRRLLHNLLKDTIGRSARKYDAAQPKLNERLTQIVGSVLKSVDRDQATKLGREPIAAALWLMDPAGETLTPWVTTDRIHRNPAMLQTVPIEPDSGWLAVRAVCEGKFLGESRTRETSRWRFIAGFPLQVSDGGEGRLPIGAITLSTLKPEESTELCKLDAAGAMLLRDRLNNSIGSWLVSTVA